MDSQQARRLTEEFRHVVARLRSTGPTSGEHDTEAAAPSCAPDSMDAVRLSLDRDIAVATRSVLVDRTRQLARALDRLARGRYGTCEECDRPIAPARLAASPEATTCVRCQGRRERRARRAATADPLDGAAAARQA